MSALVISLHVNGVLNLYSTKEEKLQQKLYENYEICYNDLKTIYNDLDSNDRAVIDSLPNPSYIENEDVEVLSCYHKKIDGILLKKSTNNTKGVWSRICDWIYEVWWRFWWWLQECDIEKGLCAIFSFVIVILTGFNRLMNHYEEWHRNRENCEKLNRELYNFHYNVGVYKLKKGDDEKKKESIFVDRVETIINDYMKDMLTEKDKITPQQIQEIVDDYKTKENKNQNNGNA